MDKKAERDKAPRLLEEIDREAPEYIAGMQAAAAKVPLDMRQGHLFACGWLDHRVREVWSFKKH
jgi:hypothetical protein